MEDYLRECMQDPALVKGPIPIDEFSKQICLQCVNSSCARSRMMGMSTYVRAQNWKRDLFDQVPRAREDDPKYSQIRSKNFISPNMQPQISIETNTVKEPFIPEVLRTETREIEQSAAEEEPVQEEKIEETGSTEQDTKISMESVIKRMPGPGLMEVPEDAKIHEVPDLKEFIADNMTLKEERKVNLNNTKFQQGSMLGGGVISKPADVVLKPGSTFTFGDDD